MSLHDADYCPTCGSPRDRLPTAVDRLGLELDLGTLKFGGKVAHICPAMSGLMRALLEKGRASSEFLILTIAPETESNLLQVYVCRVRKVLHDLTNGTVSIRTVRGWGYALEETTVLKVAA